MNHTARLLSVVFCGVLAAAPVPWPRPQRRAVVIGGNISLTAGGANQSQELSRAVVYFDAHPALSGDARRDEPRPQIVQRDKAFVPDLLVVPQGTTVEFPNWDPFSHNVFSRSRAAPFDLDR